MVKQSERIPTALEAIQEVLEGGVIKESITLVTGNKTASGNSEDNPIDVSRFRQGIFYLEVSAVGGTNPTLDVDIMVKNMASGEWYTKESFEQMTATGNATPIILDTFGQEMAIEWTISGTESPNFTFLVSADMES